MSEGKPKASLSKEGGTRRQKHPLVCPQEDSDQTDEELTEITNESITIAIFCALSDEMVAVRHSLDEEFICRPKGIGPIKYVYSFGRIREHRIVVVRPPQIGTVKSAQCAATVSQQFPNVRFALMVGIGAGIPNLDKHDIRLGDIAVSIPKDNHPGVIEYDFGKFERGGFIEKGCLNKPPAILISADGSLEDDEKMGKKPLQKFLKEITRNPRYARPLDNDILFDKDFHNVNQGTGCHHDEESKEKKIVQRPVRPHQQPVVHRGLILSGNGVIKNSRDRERLIRGHDTAICFEMEAAGIMDEIPCLVIRGISDYADTHKQDSWHCYAAAVAAAYCKALLCKIDHWDVEEARCMNELIEGVKELTRKVHHLQETQRFKEVAEKLDALKEAYFDSYGNQDGGECLESTRIDLLEEIAHWSCSPESQCIFWLNGMAGTGKSTISRTVAASFKREGILGASYFFKKGAGDQSNARRFFPTITRQLLERIPDLIPSIERAVQRNPDISTTSLNKQFNTLLLEPLQELCSSQTTVIIVIDALDECEKEDEIRELLHLLPQLQKSKSIRLRIFLTSRPELPIRLGFQEIKHQNLILHELPEPVIENDIRVFLRHKFHSIRKTHRISDEWPGDEKIETLVKLSFPLFIFAATICRFIEDPYEIPEDRLDNILDDPAFTSATQMERIYLPVLHHHLKGSKKYKENFQDIIGVIILLAAPLSTDALARLLNLPHLPQRTIDARLRAFHSVLSIPHDSYSPVRTLHLSFRNFLVNTNSEFRVDADETHKRIALYCLQTMDCNLKHNICRLSGYGTQRVDIDNQVVSQYLPSHLQYACRYWVYHLEQSQSYRVNAGRIFLFLRNHFLHWLEAISLMGLVTETISIIDTLSTAIRSESSPGLSDFLHDAKRFILKNIYIANIAPLQLYSSGLASSPTKSVIRTMFGNEQRQMHVLSQMESSWSAELQILSGHSEGVESVAFSPDGLTVASGSEDGTIKLWDARTGSEIRTFIGHDISVTLLVFSPDSLTLASTYYDISKLWDVMTGSEIWTLDGHSEEVLAVAFSPDGLTVASGSYDGAIKRWNVKTGSEIRTPTGHPEAVRPVRSVAFSPDGLAMALGSEDATIRLWDVETGREIRILRGHSGPVYSVTFCAESLTLASGSKDGTIKLWDAKTGSDIRTLKGHSLGVQLLAFSPDGLTMVTSSYSWVTSLWDVKTGFKIRTFSGHLDMITSVAFSPDGLTVVSGSEDTTIRLWDVKASSEIWNPPGHSEDVNSVALTPDSLTLASGSDDGTIKLWDVETGSEIRAITGHSGSIQSVVFSPDGLTLASGSQSGTIKLWDVKAGTEIRTLKGPSRGIQSLVFSSDGCTLAARPPSRKAEPWDFETGSEIWAFSGDPNQIQSSLTVDPGSHGKRIIFQVSIENRWVTFNGARLLWIPFKYQQFVCYTGRGSHIALGYADGRVIIIGFDAPI